MLQKEINKPYRQGSGFSNIATLRQGGERADLRGGHKGACRANKE